MERENTLKDSRGNIFSRFFFLWIEPLIFRWYTRKLELQDVPDLPLELQSDRLKKKFQKIWSSKKNPSLIHTIIILNLFKFNLSGLLVLVMNLCELCTIVLGWLILEIVINPGPDDTQRAKHGIIYCCLFTVVSYISAITYAKSVYDCSIIECKTFAQCIMALFEKSLSLPQDVLNEISIGRIMNMVANDLRNLEYKCFKIQHIWGFPLAFIGSILILYFVIGPIALVGVGVIFMSIIVMCAFTPFMGKLKSRNLEFTDKRVKFINQVIKNMRVVKMFGWEDLTRRYVRKIRRKEWVSGLIYSLMGSGAYLLFYQAENQLAMFATFLVSYIIDSPIGFGEAVLCFMLYQQIHINTSKFILLMNSCIDLYISGNRISKFLNIEVRSQKTHELSTPSFEHYIEIRGLTVEWSNQSRGLDSINLKVSREPQLLFLTGAVGAGKSTLLLTICNEISRYTGSVRVNGRVAYSAQESWVFSGTIRDNILVGSEFEYDRYWKVLGVCGLIPDLDLFSDNDLTLVGERGITLSGGQKARLSLARTVYKVADIYLLDDPLGAVDAHVSSHIFENCIKGFLRDTLVILATHQTRFARDNDRMVALVNGRIVEDNIYSEINWQPKNESIPRILADERSLSGDSENSIDVIDLDCMERRDGEIQDVNPMSTALSDEKAERSKFLVYVKYFQIGGICLTLLILLFTAVSNMAQIILIWWIQKFMWLASVTHSYQNTTLILANNLTNQTSTTAPIWFLDIIGRQHFLLICTIIITSLFFIFYEWLSFIILTWKVAVKLHSKMYSSIMGTAMRFFEINPSGRILNRFSKDTGYIDFEIPNYFLDYWILLFMIIFPLIASCIVQPILIPAVLILIVLFFASVRYYLPTAAELRSLESLLRSPLYSHFSLTLQGITTIRSLKMQSKVEEDLLYHLNSYIKIWATLQASACWFIQRFNIFIRTFLSIVVWVSFIRNYYYDAKEDIALSFQILMNIPILLYFVATLAVNLDILMVSVERVLTYVKLKPEDDDEKAVLKKLPHVDSIGRGMLYEGNITFENVYLRYDESLPMVLKGISLKIVGGSKVGIVGRTGAGKSSIINALFRLTNPSGGRILIDGVDISHLRLNRLRTRMSVIPQDPMLFTGTLRFNLDPSNQFSDSEVWSSLEHVQLRGLIASLHSGLLANVQEDGNNFSVGEKQLLCLARALLRSTRILVVDEATANVDHLTDAKIQNTLRTSFKYQTVISIAHRLNTVIYYDRIVVMDQGEIVEADHPFLLIQDSHSYLSKLISQTGPVTEKALRASAHTAYCLYLNK